MLKSVRCLSTVPPALSKSSIAPPSRQASHKACYEWGNATSSWGIQKVKDALMFRGKERVGARKEALVPILSEPPAGEVITALAYGSHHAARLMASGDLYMDGNGEKGELGLGEATKMAMTPQKVPGLPRVKQVECGANHTLALTADGRVYSWGFGGSFLLGCGALGHGTKTDVFVPKLIEALPPITQIACGESHCLALAENGEVFAWGAGAYGVLGTGSSKDLLVPEPVALTNVQVRKIDCGMNFSGVLSTDGVVHLWGRNEQHQLATPPGIVLEINSMETLPTPVELGTKVADFALGTHHTVVCTEEKEVLLWGMRKFAQPERVAVKDVVQVAAGNDFSVAVDRFGQLFTWGDGRAGCLGHGDTNSVPQPQAVQGFGPPGHGHQLGSVERVFASGKNVGVLTR